MVDVVIETVFVDSVVVTVSIPRSEEQKELAVLTPLRAFTTKSTAWQNWAAFVRSSMTWCTSKISWGIAVAVAASRARDFK